MEKAIDPARFTDPDDVGHNNSSGPGFNSVLQARVSRRAVLKGGLGFAVTSMFGAGLAACGGKLPPGGAPLALTFSAVAKSVADAVTVPSG